MSRLPEPNIPDALPLGLFWKDLNRCYLGCNQTFARDFGFKSPGDIVGLKDTDFIPLALAARLEVAFDAALANSSSEACFGLEGLLPAAPGKSPTVICSPLKDSEGTVIGVTGHYDVSRLFSDEEKLRSENQERFRALFKASSDGMWLIKDNAFVAANPAAAKMLHYETAEALFNIHPASLSPDQQPDGQDSFEKANEMMRIAHRDGSHRFEWDHLTKGGDILPVDVTLTQMPVEGQMLLLCVWRDISRQKEEERTLRAARDAAEATTHLKSEFLANMSHEIRTPMTGILGMLDLIPENLLPGEHQTYLANARHSATALLSIINDILDLSRLEAGETAVSHSDVNIKNLFRQIIHLLGHSATSKGLTLKTRVSGNVPTLVSMDGNHLRQILINLVSNALKFTDSGQVTMAVSLADVDDGNQKLLFVVEDTGVGIEAEKIDLIFDRFGQIDGSSEQGQKGTGLGLPICKELAEVLGGELSVESVFGEGSRFQVSLPYLPTDTVETVEAAGPEKTASGTGINACYTHLHVLVAEDNATNQLVITTLLKKLGASFEVTGNGKEVVARLEKPPVDATPIDLVLMDIQMPIMDGVEATQIIRNLDDETMRTIPVLAFTANAMAGQREQYLDAGMNGYITKPVIVNQMVSEIDRVLSAAASAK